MEASGRESNFLTLGKETKFLKVDVSDQVIACHTDEKEVKTEENSLFRNLNNSQLNSRLKIYTPSVPVKSLCFSFTVHNNLTCQTGFTTEFTGLDRSSYCGQ